MLLSGGQANVFLMTRTDIVLETLAYLPLSNLTRLVGQEYFIPSNKVICMLTCKFKTASYSYKCILNSLLSTVQVKNGGAIQLFFLILDITHWYVHTKVYFTLIISTVTTNTHIHTATPSTCLHGMDRATFTFTLCKFGT